MSRADDLRADYDYLGALLAVEEDSAKAAGLVRERRIVGELLESLETPKESTVVDQLAAKRKRAGASGASSRRRKSG